MVGQFNFFCGTGYTAAALHAYSNCTAMGPAGYLREAAALHCSPWEAMITDPTSQPKMNLD